MDSGAFYAEIIDVESGNDLFDERGEFASAAGLTTLLLSFLRKLGDPLG
ncbi:immunity protein TriTu family protein [Duganella rhizosphaerae]